MHTIFWDFGKNWTELTHVFGSCIDINCIKLRQRIVVRPIGISVITHHVHMWHRYHSGSRRIQIAQIVRILQILFIVRIVHTRAWPMMLTVLRVVCFSAHIMQKNLVFVNTMQTKQFQKKTHTNKKKRKNLKTSFGHDKIYTAHETPTSFILWKQIK